MLYLKNVILTAAAAIGAVAVSAAPAISRDIVTPSATYGVSGTQILNRGDAFVSEDGRFRFVFQYDGNLVLNQGSAVLWASDVYVNYNRPPIEETPQTATFQGDGNLVVIFNPSKTKNHAVWTSKTYGHPAATLIVQNDGNVVIYENGRKLWATNTCCH